MKRGVALPWWSDCFALVWSFWYILGDYDALALCYLGGFIIGDDLAIFGGVSLHVGDLDFDALVLEVILEDLSMVRYTLEVDF